MPLARAVIRACHHGDTVKPQVLASNLYYFSRRHNHGFFYPEQPRTHQAHGDDRDTKMHQHPAIMAAIAEYGAHRGEHPAQTWVLFTPLAYRARQIGDQGAKHKTYQAHGDHTGPVQRPHRQRHDHQCRYAQGHGHHQAATQTLRIGLAPRHQGGDGHEQHDHQENRHHDRIKIRCAHGDLGFGQGL